MKNNKTLSMVASFPGKYIQNEDTMYELPLFVNKFGSKALLITSNSIIKNILPKFGFLENTSDFIICKFNGESSESELIRIESIIQKNEVDVIIGMGGGKVIDTAKIVADRCDCAVIIVPTIASSDAPCSGCAVIYSDKGEFESVYYQKSNPQVVLVDTKIISESPVRYLIAGMGDALATRFEAESCKRTMSKNECGGISTLAGYAIAKLCYDTLLENASAAIISNENKIVTPALNNIIEANILLSGIGFESSGVAAAHAIHNGLTALPETNNYLHGEKVAFGTLVSLHLTGYSIDIINEVYGFCEKVGLPTTLGEIGLGNITKDDIFKVAQKSVEPNQSIHHEAGIMTDEKVAAAIILADNYGKKRKFQ